MRVWAAAAGSVCELPFGEFDPYTPPPRLTPQEAPCTRPVDGCIHARPPVRSLWLYDNFLTGGLPTELGRATENRDIFAYENRLDGSLPTELGQMISLQTLYARVGGCCGLQPLHCHALPWAHTQTCTVL
jgi:hypothetical protein